MWPYPLSSLHAIHLHIAVPLTLHPRHYSILSKYSRSTPLLTFPQLRHDSISPASRVSQLLKCIHGRSIPRESCEFPLLTHSVPFAEPLHQRYLFNGLCIRLQLSSWHNGRCSVEPLLRGVVTTTRLLQSRHAGPCTILRGDCRPATVTLRVLRGSSRVRGGRYGGYPSISIIDMLYGGLSGVRLCWHVLSLSELTAIV